MTTIEGWIFDLSNLVYLRNPSNKFWEGTLNNKTLDVRVGKVKGSVETSVETMTKTYPTVALARASMIEKITDKLVKGYTSDKAVRAVDDGATKGKRQNVGDKEDIEATTLATRKKEEEKPSRAFSGQYYEKDGEGIRLEVNNHRVKITRVAKNNKEDSEIREFKTHKQAVEYCIAEEDRLLEDKYVTLNSKFIYSFVDDEEDGKPARNTRTKNATSSKSTSKSNALSIIGMTDDVMSGASRVLSPVRSDRSAVNDDDDDVELGPSSLGNPASGCIKVLLAETWDDGVDPTGWYMSEKLDGVRCFWTGTQMFSRNGNRFYPPKFFVKGWPKSQLDGELFIGRDRFSETISAVKKTNPIDSEWQKVSFLVFDCPGYKRPFNQRIEAMEKAINACNSPYLKCHAHRVCTGFTDMFNELEEVTKIKGEGLMLRDPGSAYENRRSKTLLKVKVFYDDEATVLGYTPGTGRCQGMVGALRVRNTHGVEFEVGSGLNDDMRRHPPKVGTMITYKYQEFMKSGKPRFPTFLRIYQPL